MFSDDDTPALLDLFQNDPARYKIVVTLLSQPPKQFSKYTLAEEAGVSRRTITRQDDFLKFLVEIGFLKLAEGNTGYREFQLNLESDLVQSGIEWLEATERAKRRYEDDIEEAAEDFFLGDT